jgi:hypothetical protein
MEGRIHTMVLAAAAGAAFLASGPALAGTGALASSPGRPVWGAAEEVPGIAALNQGGAEITSVSCGSAGYCSAGGWYTGSSFSIHAFVVSEARGAWHTAIEVPGTASGGGEIFSVSCASAGNCSAGGEDTDSSGDLQPFVVSQVHGVWGTAVQMPGPAALTNGGGEITSVSCASAGNCSAGGDYEDSSYRGQTFVVSQVHGVWGTAVDVPGIVALSQGEGAEITSVSCGSAGNCSAGGSYEDSSGLSRAFMVSQVHGVWRTAVDVPGIVALSQGVRGDAEVTSVSCTSAGNCGAGGFYGFHYYEGTSQPFVVSEVHGVWRTAAEVPGPGMTALSQARDARGSAIEVPPSGGGGAEITSVSCGSAGYCSAGGWYQDSSYRDHAFVVSQARGVWHSAIEVPGTAALNQGGSAEITSVSCGSAGNCSAGGSYEDSSYRGQAFVVSQVHGVWGTAVEVPGTAALNQGGLAGIASVSCASAGNCSAGGTYQDGSSHSQVFVVSETSH